MFIKEHFLRSLIEKVVLFKSARGRYPENNRPTLSDTLNISNLSCRSHGQPRIMPLAVYEVYMKFTCIVYILPHAPLWRISTNRCRKAV